MTSSLRDCYHRSLAKIKRFDKAEQLEREDLKRYESLDKYSFDSVWSCYGLSQILSDKGDIERAETFYRDALHRCRIRDGEEFLRTEIGVYVVLGLENTLFIKREYIEAQQILEEALKACPKKLEWGGDNYHIEDILGRLYRCLMRQGKIDKAVQLKLEYPEAF